MSVTSWSIATSSPAARAPAGTRIYVIGDIHGRADLLREILGWIRGDLADSAAARPLVVYLGDYVDRGPDSRDVVDLVRGESLPGARSIQLCGNHERMMLDFLGAFHVGAAWLANGGDATLLSYGIAPPAHHGPADMHAVQARLRAALPRGHRAFLHSLATAWNEGDYLFVHAGIRPGIALERQRDEDMLWIREEFLLSEADHGKVVVHGHSITREPDVRPNRIGIDTGAFASNRLTCLVLEGESRRFAQTAP